MYVVQYLYNIGYGLSKMIQLTGLRVPVYASCSSARTLREKMCCLAMKHLLKKNYFLICTRCTRNKIKTHMKY